MAAQGIRKSWRSSGAARILLGAFLLTAGLAKVPDVDGFATALQSIAGLGPAPAFWSAVGVLGVEIIVGSLLVLGIYRVAAGLSALIIAAAFAGVQSVKLLRGTDVPCHCLGVLGELPGGIELGLDILLFLLALAVLRERGRAEGVRRAGRTFVLLGVIVPGCLLMLRLAVPDSPAMNAGGQVILQKLKAEQTAGPGDARVVVVCLNLEDFQCSVCFDDLISLLDTVRSINVPGLRKEVAAVLRMGGTFADSARGGLHRWARETGIAGPVAVVSAEEFDDATGGRSLLWVTEGMERVAGLWELPLGASRRREVIAALAF